MENKNISDLTELIKKIEANEILLPDFQREFVWKDMEQQKQLVASVLARMPIGSILLLQSSNPKEFSSKALGRKQIINTSELGGNVEYLLDGQQRMTVLTNVFSNAIFQGLTSVNDLVAPLALKRRFFIKLPKWKSAENSEEDIFGFHDLNFPTENLENPTYLSGDIMPNLEAIEFNKNDGKAFNPFTPEEKAKSNDLAKFCTSKDDYYLIPLYLIASNDKKNINKITRIKTEIKLNYISDMKDHYDALQEDEQQAFVAKYEEEIDEDRDFGAVLGEVFDTWWSSFSEYLKDCIKNIILNQIVVSEAQRGRAIDIYENLNRGGVSLNTFDLMTAKVAVVSSEGLYQRLIKYILQPTEIDKTVIPECMDTEVAKLTDYNASLRLGCYNENNNTIASKYLNAFLDIISLRCYNPDYVPADFKLDYLKQDKILSLSPKSIDENVAVVCKGIDRACYFLQTRCGIRKLSEVNNLFILVLLACIFIKDEWFHKKKVHDLLEAWYWCVIFSGEFDKDQNRNFIKNIQLLVKTMEDPKDINWLKDMKGKILAAEDYSDKALLLYEKVDNERYPKKNLVDYICQYLLSKTYRSMFDHEEVISAFSEKARSENTLLEAHHIIPLGSVKKIGQVSSALRKNSRSIFNSPLNFIYITKRDNNAISDKSVNDYIHQITPEAKKSLMLTQFKNDQYTEAEVKNFLSERFDSLQGSICERVGQLLDGIA
jgi:uncharacterized protein with ParB-like and HNH nuclease domain